MRNHRLANRVVHKSTGGVLPWTPQPVDPVGNPLTLTANTVALPSWGEAMAQIKIVCAARMLLLARTSGDGLARGRA